MSFFKVCVSGSTVLMVTGFVYGNPNLRPPSPQIRPP